MPAINSKILTAASEIAGKPVIAAVWLQSKSLPWYTTNGSGAGGLLDLLLMVACATYRRVFPKPRNGTENLLDHSGTMLSVLTTSELVFIACRDQGSIRELTHELRRFSLSALSSCIYDYPSMTDVNFQFNQNNSSESLTLHFVGDRNDLVKFAASASAPSSRTVAVGQTKDAAKSDR